MIKITITIIPLQTEQGRETNKYIEKKRKQRKKKRTEQNRTEKEQNRTEKKDNKYLPQGWQETMQVHTPCEADRSLPPEIQLRAF